MYSFRRGPNIQNIWRRMYTLEGKDCGIQSRFGIIFSTYVGPPSIVCINTAYLDKAWNVSFKILK
jgi:hypothetical protein